MNLTPLMEAIIELVEIHQGMKATDLVLKVAARHIDVPNKDISGQIDRLVKNGDIVEVEYVLPSMEYRVKSFYLPKGTKVKLWNHS